MHHWNWSHFLFHYRDGRYARNYRQVTALGASLDDFETLIGAVDDALPEWYQCFMHEISRVKASGRGN